MAKNYWEWTYWFAVNHAERFYKSVNDTILFDNNQTLEKMITEPTIFLANHTSEINIPHMHYAIQSSLSRHPQDANRVIRTISKDDNFRHGKLGPVKNNLFNFFSQIPGTILIKQKGSENPYPRDNIIPSMRTTLSAGNHVLIFSMGDVSGDGRVDHKREEDLLTFEYRFMALIPRRVPNVHVQTMHYTTDVVNNRFLIRMGERHLVKDMTGYNFTDEIAKCTTITGLQLLSLYKKVANDLGIILTKKSLSKELSEFSEELQKKGYHVYDPKNTMDDAIAYADSGKEYILDIRYKLTNTASSEYQSNQIKHLHLDESIRRFQEKRRR